MPSDEEIVNLVQRKRLELLSAKEAVYDKDMLMLLRDTANTSQKNLTINVEKDGAAALADIAGALLQKASESGVDPHALPLDAIDAEFQELREVSLDEELPEFELVAGETSTEPSEIEYSAMFGDKD